jgi:hypothetical protein
VGACSGTYRYLSKYVGNGSSKGKAIWKPKITVNGLYQVKAGYRATVNRTTDADYYLHDDLGGVVHKVVNQAHPGDCTYENLGAIHCVVGGQLPRGARRHRRQQIRLRRSHHLRAGELR